MKQLSDWEKEMEKCLEDPYYYNNYFLIDGKKPTVTREEWDKRMREINKPKSKSPKEWLELTLNIPTKIHMVI